MRTGLALMLLLLATASAWLAYETFSAMLAAPAGGMFSAGAMRGLAFGLAMCGVSLGLLWLLMRALRQPRS
jgi:hypothetical protein